MTPAVPSGHLAFGVKLQGSPWLEEILPDFSSSCSRSSLMLPSKVNVTQEVVL